MVCPIDSVESFAVSAIDPKLDGGLGDVKFIGNALKGFVATIGGNELTAKCRRGVLCFWSWNENLLGKTLVENKKF